MRTDKEKWNGNPKRSDSNSGRDGNFGKRDVKSILKNSNRIIKSGSDNSFRNDKRTENKYDSPRSDSPKPRTFDRNTGNSYGNNSGNSSGNRDNRGERSNNYGSRDRNNNYSDRSDKPYVKRYNQDGYQGGGKPYVKRYNQDGGDKPYVKRNNQDGYQDRGDRPYVKRDSQDEDPNRKILFRKKEDVEANREGKFIETRFDNKKDGISFRKPRAKDPDYDPNAKYSHKKRMEYKQDFVDPTKPVRLNKFLANAGICSRREADEYIAAGVISVNGQVVSELGVKVLPTDKVMFHEQPVQSERKVYLLLNKPKDCITTSEDKHAKLTVLDLVKNACSERIYPVGRLDRNTTGVLLLTNDGDLASKLTHPKYEKKKIYQVTLNNTLEEKDFKAILDGIELEDGVIAADALEYLENGKGKQIGIEIHSGKNRVVRRIFDKLGYKVMRLDRVYFAGLTKKNVPRGKYRFLNEREVAILKMGAHE